MNLIIPGGHGFIGKRICALLKEQGHDAVPLSRQDGFDLLDYPAFVTRLKELKPDAIINCAAHVGNLNYVTAHAAEVIHDNVQMALNLYRAVHEACPGARIINPLANCSYPGTADIQKESDWWQGEVHASVFSFGNSRRFLYVIAACYAMQYGVRTINFLVPNTFGPGDHTDIERVHALNGMIIRMIKAHRAGEAGFTVWGTGKPIREWAYVDDVTRVLAKSLTMEEDLTYPVNIAQNKGYTIKESAELIAEAIGFQGKINFDASKPDGAPVKVLDDGKFRKLFPDFKFTDHKEGIKETVRYYESVL